MSDESNTNMSTPPAECDAAASEIVVDNDLRRDHAPSRPAFANLSGRSRTSEQLTDADDTTYPTEVPSNRQLGQHRFKLYSIKEVLNLPPPDWLITKVLPVGSQGVLFGQSGTGKSFVALDMALSVATGEPWQGHEVKRGPVVYVAAEGGHGVGKRVDAWVQRRGVAPVDEMFFVLKPVQLKDKDQIDELLQRIEAHNKKPALIVFDTLARCFVDGEENSAKDVGVLVHHAGILQQETGAAVLMLHHTGRAANDHERGSTALRGAADVMISLKQDNGIITLRNTKQKDASEFEPMTFLLDEIEVTSPKGEGCEGERVTSCVVIPARAESTVRDDVLNAGQRMLLVALLGVDNKGTTSGNWRKAIRRENNKDVPERTFQNRRRSLMQRGLVERVADSSPARYRLSQEGHFRATALPS